MPKRPRGSRPKYCEQLAVDALGDPRRAHQQFVRRLRGELRIAAQEFQERRKVAGEAGRLHRRLHLRVDARDFLQADLVDRFGIEIERGVCADLLAVERLAVGQRFGGERRARMRHVVVAEELQQLRVGRQHALADRLGAVGAQRRLLVGRNVRRQLLERLVEDRCPAAFFTSAIVEIDTSRPTSTARGTEKPRFRPARMLTICSSK